MQDFSEGKVAALKFMIGQVMRLTKGTANPDVAMKTLVKELNR